MSGALVAAVVSPSIAWVLEDRRLWPWDQAWYGEVSADLFFLLTHAPRAWLSAMIGLMPSKPPLLCWLGQFFIPLTAVTGNVEASLLAFIVVIEFATLLLVWFAGRALAPDNRWASIAAVLLAGSAPLFIGLSHQYFVEPLQTCVVAASLLLAIMAPRLRPLRLAGFLALLVVMGFGAKTTTFLYCGATWLVTARAFARPAFRESSHSMKRGDGAGWLAIGLALALGSLTALWYLANFAQIQAHMRASVADTLYGAAGPFSNKLLYWIVAADGAFSSVAFVCIALVLASGLAVTWALRRGDLSGDRERVLVAASALVQIVAPMALLASQPNEETRFLLPILPNLAILAAWLLRRPSWRIPAIVASAFFAVQWSFGHLQAHGLIGHAQSPWLLAVDTDESNRSVAREIVHKTCAAADANRMNVVGPEYPQMNANSVAFFAAQERLKVGYRCFYTSLGYAEVNVERALARIEALNALFVVLPRPADISENPDAFNRVLRPVQVVLAASPEFSRIGMAGGYEIFRRK